MNLAESEAIAAGMAEYRRTIRPRLRLHAAVIAAFVVLALGLAGLPLPRALGFGGLAGLMLWLLLAWLERAWLPANLRDRYRRSGPKP